MKHRAKICQSGKSHPRGANMDPYENLANAVIMQAVKDWRGAVCRLKKGRRNEFAEGMKNECERFFLSGWFMTLTDCDGRAILERLREEENI